MHRKYVNNILCIRISTLSIAFQGEIDPLLSLLLQYAENGLTTRELMTFMIWQGEKTISSKSEIVTKLTNPNSLN